MLRDRSGFAWICRKQNSEHELSGETVAGSGGGNYILGVEIECYGWGNDMWEELWHTCPGMSPEGFQNTLRSSHTLYLHNEWD